jgi:nitroimidazol reductase NimA-like FMN-containing flavoprotein (pyridoxamine 5'-phosphate oxidase superfamily)
MLGELNETQIDSLLLSQVVGRIGCTDGKKPYITPVTYVFDGKDIIGQTKEGMKLKIMRKNPMVCFEVDVMSGMTNWQSVVVSGNFCELEGKEADEARAYLFDHVLPLMTSASIHSHEHGINGKVDDSNRVKPVMYRIKIKEQSGRFEKQ